MPLTNAEIQRRYREKLKNNNLEAYKEKKRLEFKKHYHKNNLQDDIIDNKDDDIIDKKDDIIIIELKPISKRISPLNKSVLNDNTKKQYLSIIKKLYYEYNNNNILPPDIEEQFILNFNNKPYDYKILINSLSFLKNNLLQIIKNYYSNINNIYAVITRIKYFSFMVKMLFPYIEEKQIKYNEKRDNKKIEGIIKTKIDTLSFDKIDILNNLNKLNDNIDKLIYGLFTLFPTRRPNDYRIMLFSDILPSKNNIENNFYFNHKFYFFHTKNKQKQIFDIPPELDNLILSNKNNKYLLGKLFPSSSFSKKIMDVFFKIYDFKISAVEIRRFYATSLNNLSDIERKKISNMMNHRLEENKKYAFK